ncbi:MAG: hypothetical protein V4812_17920 [Pseudomonadota bacterium]
MNKRLRSALIWLLIMTLPAQSLAATAMQLCALASPSEAISAAAHHPHATAAMVHGADANAAQDPHTGGAIEHSASSLDHSLCSLCAFCVGAVALSAVFSSHSLPPTVEPSLLRLEQFVGFIADTPERPPRLFLA